MSRAWRLAPPVLEWQTAKGPGVSQPFRCGLISPISPAKQALRAWPLSDSADHFAMRAAHFGQVFQPVTFGCPVTQRHQHNRAQATRLQAQNLVNLGRIKAFHRGGVDFFKGGSGQGDAQRDIGLASGVLKIRFRGAHSIMAFMPS